MIMENGCFIIIPVVLAAIVLTFQFFKTEEDYKMKSKEIKQKIEKLKKKNMSLQKQEHIDAFHSDQMNEIMQQFLYLHNLIVKKHLR